MWTFLSSLKVSAELSAFVVFTIIFMLFRLREQAESNKTQKIIADAIDNRLKSLGELQERVAESFQGQVREMDKRTYENQVRYQEQLQILTDSHIGVSRESIRALAKIEIAFQTQSVRLEHVERKVEEFGRGLPRPQGDPKNL